MNAGRQSARLCRGSESAALCLYFAATRLRPLVSPTPAQSVVKDGIPGPLEGGAYLACKSISQGKGHVQPLDPSVAVHFLTESAETGAAGWGAICWIFGMDAIEQLRQDARLGRIDFDRLIDLLVVQQWPPTRSTAARRISMVRFPAHRMDSYWKITEAALKSGDRILVGQTTLVFLAGSENEGSPNDLANMISAIMRAGQRAERRTKPPQSATSQKPATHG